MCTVELQKNSIFVKNGLILFLHTHITVQLENDFFIFHLILGPWIIVNFSLMFRYPSNNNKISLIRSSVALKIKCFHKTTRTHHFQLYFIQHSQQKTVDRFFISMKLRPSFNKSWQTYPYIHPDISSI